MQDLRQSPEYRVYMQSIGWQVEQGMFIKKLPLLPFSFIKIQRGKLPANWKIIAKKNRAVLIKIEPAWSDKTDYKQLGFRPDRSPMLPQKTIWLDLKKSEKQLLKEMHSTTRRNVLKHKILNSKFQITIEKFYEIYKENCRRQKFWGLKFNQLKYLLKAFNLKSYLLGYKNLGGLIILVHDRVAYYSHNASTEKGRQQFIPTVLTWQAIKLAKKLSCKKFDFEGINDQLWPGFTRFKRSFGGIEVEYKQSISQWRLP